jgi:hypothetical protein
MEKAILVKFYSFLLLSLYSKNVPNCIVPEIKLLSSIFLIYLIKIFLFHLKLVPQTSYFTCLFKGSTKYEKPYSKIK